MSIHFRVIYSKEQCLYTFELFIVMLNTAKLIFSIIIDT